MREEINELIANLQSRKDIAALQVFCDSDSNVVVYERQDGQKFKVTLECRQ